MACISSLLWAHNFLFFLSGPEEGIHAMDGHTSPRPWFLYPSVVEVLGPRKKERNFGPQDRCVRMVWEEGIVVIDEVGHESEREKDNVADFHD